MFICHFFAMLCFFGSVFSDAYRSAKPLFSGSNPDAASSFCRLFDVF